VKHFSRVTFGEAKTAQETLEHVRRQDWECRHSGHQHARKSGLDILDDLHRLRPKLPVLLLSMHPEGQYADVRSNPAPLVT